MKKQIKRLSLLLLAVIIVLGQLAVLNTSALPATNEVTVSDKTYEIIEDEVYGAYESFAECVEDLDPSEYPEIDMDDSVWYMQMQVEDWWFATTYYYTADGPVKDNFYCFQRYTVDNSGSEAVVVERVKNYRQSMALDVKEERLAITLSCPWNGAKDNPNDGDAKIVFVAPKNGRVVMFNEGKVQAAAEDSVFKAFPADADTTVEICIKKNDVVVSEYVKISKENRSADFPEMPNFKVEKGDEIEIYIKATNVSWQANNTIFLDPVIAYTEVEKQEAPVIPDFNAGTDGDTDTDTDADNKNDGPSIFLIIGISAAALVVIAAIAVVVILVIKKKKATPVISTEEEKTE